MGESVRFSERNTGRQGDDLVVARKKHLRKRKERSCSRKLLFSTFSDAYKAAESLYHDKGDKVFPYRCQFGVHWHNGHWRYRDIRW